MAIKVFDLASEAVQTTDATATVLLEHTISEGKAVTIRAEAVGSISTYASAIGISLWGVFRRASAGNVTQVGSTQGTAQEDDADTPAIAFNVNTTDQKVEIQVTGIVSETWNWRGIMRVVEVDE